MWAINAQADISDSASERRFSIPGSAQGISIPKEDWVVQREQRRPGDSAAYYMLASEIRKTTFSVYIDKTAVCQTSESCLEASLKNPQYKDAKNLKKSAEGVFQVASFLLSQPKGLPVEQANVIASAYVDGIWYDVHLSIGAKDQPDFGVLNDVLKLVKIS